MAHRLFVIAAFCALSVGCSSPKETTPVDSGQGSVTGDEAGSGGQGTAGSEAAAGNGQSGTGDTGTGGESGAGSQTSSGGQNAAGSTSAEAGNGNSGGSDAGTGGQGGAPTEDCQCDDGFACTIDTCIDWVCVHTIGPNAGETACPPGEFCTIESGCMPSVACSTTQQCVEAFAGDACRTDIACEAESAVCTFALLDKDGDGHPPRVCGGDDCNDNDASIYPDAEEICNGKDEDCDGEIDVGAVCEDELRECRQAMCECKAGHTCPTALGCVDKLTDMEHCGACGNACPSDANCVSGECVCPDGQIACNLECVDPQRNDLNCGECDNACSGSSCLDGVCSCIMPMEVCGDACVDTQTDVGNCGTCGNACPTGRECVGGSCTECDIDEDCPVDYTCINHICDGGEPQACNVDEDCDEGSICRNRLCEEAATTCGLPFDPCTYDYECCIGLFCQSSQCS